MKRVRPPQGVRLRVTVAASLTALAVGVLGATAFVLVLSSQLEDNLLTTAGEQASLTAQQLDQGQSEDDAVSPGNDDVVVQVVDASGTLLATDPPNVPEALMPSPGTRRSIDIRALHGRFSAAAARTSDGRIVVVARSEKQVSDAVETTVGLIAAALPVGLALVAVTVWLTVGRALRPVESLRRQAEAITSRDLDRRLDVPPGRDEIPRLAVTLNDLLSRVDAYQRRQRQFVSDASHELRSPLATVRQLAEVARRHPNSISTDALADNVLVEERRMEGLVEALLVLARMDDGHRAEAVVLDLDDVVLTEVARLRHEPGPAVETSAVSAGQVRGDQVLLAQVVRNLLDNARRHAHERVTLKLREQGDQVVLVVDDDGNGVPVDHREAIFGRFVRLDESRSRDAGGSGLGLAIVRKAAEEMHGIVEVGDSPSGGARFTISLPSAAARRAV